MYHHTEQWTAPTFADLNKEKEEGTKRVKDKCLLLSSDVMLQFGFLLKRVKDPNWSVNDMLSTQWESICTLFHE